MKANIEFLIIAYFVSLFIDWIFQSDWQATNKSKWIKSNYTDATWAVISHSGVYAIMTTFILALLQVITTENQVYIVFFALYTTHMIIDTRIPVKWIMRFKGMTWEQINDYKTFGFMHIGIDHRLHELVLLILAFIV